MDDLTALLAAHGAAIVFAATLAARLGAPVPAAPFLVVAGSLSVFGPSVRLSDAQIAKFGKLLMREARELSQVLGKARSSIHQ